MMNGETAVSENTVPQEAAQSVPQEAPLSVPQDAHLSATPGGEQPPAQEPSVDPVVAAIAGTSETAPAPASQEATPSSNDAPASTEAEQPRRRVQLNPTVNPEQARPVASYGSSAAPVTAPDEVSAAPEEKAPTIS
jgi:hypothetical protein